MSNIPTNVRDLDSYIVADAVKRQEQRDDGKFLIYTPAYQAIERSISQTLNDAGLVENGRIKNLIDDAADEYKDRYGSGSDRRAVLFKLFADVRDVIPTLEPKPEIKFSKNISDKDMDQILKSLADEWETP